MARCLPGNLATRVVILGVPLIQFKAEIAMMVVLMLCVTLSPLLVFAPQLSEAKRKGLREYRILAMRYMREFDAKWLRGSVTGPEPLVGSADVQSLADMDSSYDIVRTMRTAPVTKDTVFRLIVATLVPIVPLLLTMMPLEELLRKLTGILF